MYKEDLTRMVISYEITTSISSVYHMTQKIGDFLAFKMNILSICKHIIDTYVVNDVTCTRKIVITRVVIRFL